MKYFNINDAKGLQEQFGVTEKNAPGWLAGFYDPILLYRIPAVAKDINAEWLLTGDGEMLKVKEPEVINTSVIELLKKENERLEEALHRAEARYDKLLEKYLEK
ncbi:MAG: hypothetical protein IKG90_02650 [Bacteroidales bacterium]|nr:hypothetical protein [Bacteroidales bacterium]